jgi:hypothetical protein
MMSNNSALIIPPPSPAGMTNELRAIRPPVEIPNDWAWVWWTLGALVVGALVIIALIWFFRKRVQPPLIQAIPPHVRAKQKLAAALSLIHDPRLFCIEVSTIARIYLEERFNFHAPERTTEEFLVELQSTNLLTPDQKQSLGEFLQSCDLVKFARFEPTEAALRELHDSALRLVDETQFEAIRVDSTGVVPRPPALPPAITEHAGANDQ